jgi:hypothetical protein
MGWNFRKSVNLGGGFRVNLSKRGVGASAGIPGLRFGLGPRGKRLQVSIPGTGMYYRKEESWGSPIGRPTSSSATLGRLAQVAAVGIAGVSLVVWLLSLFS